MNRTIIFSTLATITLLSIIYGFGVQVEWYREGKRIAQRAEAVSRSGNIEEGIRLFEEAQAHGVTLRNNNNAEARARAFASDTRFRMARTFLKSGKVAEAVVALNEGRAFRLNEELKVGTLREFCWEGTIRGHPEEVLHLCDELIQHEWSSLSDYEYRSIARALSGDTAGAIDDLRFLIENAPTDSYYSNRSEEELNQIIAQRQAWIEALEAGTNPFDKETLQQLR